MRGELRVALDLNGTYIGTSHGVAPDQFEPGVPEAGQAREHVLDYTILGMDLAVDYGLIDEVSVGLMLPVRMIVAGAEFRDVDGRAMPGFESIHHRDEVLGGVGDLQLRGHFTLLTPTPELPVALVLKAGVSLPTGNIEPDPFVAGANGVVHQHMFFGSGTVDPIVGARLTYSPDIHDDVSLAMAVWGLARLALYDNRHGFRPPTLASGGLGMQTNAGVEGLGLTLQLETLVETQARWNSQIAENSGRIDLALGLGASYAIDPNWTVYGLVRIPLWRETLGGQLNMPFIASVGFESRFDLLGDDG